LRCHVRSGDFGAGRFGASALDFVSIGSVLSVRAFIKAGSGLSLLDRVRAAYKRDGDSASTSVCDYFHIGSTLSLRGLANSNTVISIHGSTQLGRRLEPRSAGAILSVLSFVHFGSSLSIRAQSRLHGAMGSSVLSF
jgi:hypothetical protein